MVAKNLADSASQSGAGNSNQPSLSQPQQPQPSASTLTPTADAPVPVPGPSTGHSSSSQISSDAMRQLVEFADAGIEDLTTFLGLVSFVTCSDKATSFH